jgi:hypothetical protein
MQGSDQHPGQCAFSTWLAVDMLAGPTAGTVLDLGGMSAFCSRDERITRIVDRR